MRKDSTAYEIDLVNMEEVASQIIDVLKNSMNRKFTEEDHEKILNAILLSSAARLIETQPANRKKE